jgi:beta-lactamase regulating signal transducer with metallopeptidase domain
MESSTMHLLSEISRFTAQAFLSGLWQGLVLIAAVGICLRLLPRMSASVRFAIWGFAFTLVAAIPLLHSRMLAARHPNASSADVHLAAAWGFAIAVVWAAMMVMRTSQLLIQVVRLRHIWRRAKPVVAKGEILALLRTCKRRAELCTSVDVDSPSVIGFFSPRLLIPEWLLEKLTGSELRQIVLHECEHLRRGDDWMNLLQKIALALFPLNPALLWVDRRLSLERELACDVGVVNATAAPFDYARSLTRLAEYRMRYRRVALALSAWSRQSELAKRVHSLLQPMRTMSPLQARASVVLLGIGLTGGAVEMARVPGFVSFSDAVSAPLEQAATNLPRQTGVQYLPVVYNRASQPHATLLKATLPSSQMHRFDPAPKLSIKHPLPTELLSVSAAGVVQRPHMVLTAEKEPTEKMENRRSSRNAVRPAYVVSTEFSYTYAAVPFGDGWLIIQL